MVVREGIVLVCVSSSLIAFVFYDDGVITWELLTLTLLLNGSET